MELPCYYIRQILKQYIKLIFSCKNTGSSSYLYDNFFPFQSGHKLSPSNYPILGKYDVGETVCI